MLGHAPWQQAVLESQCGRTLAGELARIVDVDRSSGCDLLSEEQIVIIEGRMCLMANELCQPQRTVMGP
ncbi:hypothetical protein SALBM311S_00205 [Streptomyces alboniger]